MANTIKIGHASISENHTIYGEAGDQTGKEVYIVEKYNIANIEPYIVLRPKTTALANASVAACIAGCNNDNIGYSQNTRNTLYNQAKELNFDLSKVDLCNTDCSAFMTVCAIAGGAKITYGTNAPTTSNMRARFSKSGDYEVLTNSKYTTMTDYLKAGDILVHSGSHTMMVLENGGSSDSTGEDEQLVNDLQTFNITTKVTDLKNNSATINIKTVKQLNELELPISNDSWVYFIEYGKFLDNNTIERQITTNKISINDLAEDTCYTYRIKVKKNNTDFFCSANKTFVTTRATTNYPELADEHSGRIEVAYIKTATDDYRAVNIFINNGVY